MLLTKVSGVCNVSNLNETLYLWTNSKPRVHSCSIFSTDQLLIWCVGANEQPHILIKIQFSAQKVMNIFYYFYCTFIDEFLQLISTLSRSTSKTECTWLPEKVSNLIHFLMKCCCNLSLGATLRSEKQDLSNWRGNAVW